MLISPGSGAGKTKFRLLNNPAEEIIMPFQIIRNDITKVRAEVIVNTANPYPVIGNGTDSAVYRAAGEQQLFDELSE